MDANETITCVECDGTAHLVSYEPPEGWEQGQVVAYACEDCGHRLDIVFEEPPEDSAR